MNQLSQDKLLSSASDSQLNSSYNNNIIDEHGTLKVLKTENSYCHLHKEIAEIVRENNAALLSDSCEANELSFQSSVSIKDAVKEETSYDIPANNPVSLNISKPVNSTNSPININRITGNTSLPGPAVRPWCPESRDSKGSTSTPVEGIVHD